MKKIKAELQEPPIARILSGVSFDKRKRWIELATKVCEAVQGIKELSNGYSLQLPNDQETIVATAEYTDLREPWSVSEHFIPTIKTYVGI